MASRLDRELQKQILNALAENYPNRAEKIINDLMANNEDVIFLANMLYLEDHGLIISGLKQTLSGNILFTGGTQITKDGLDFVADDGGLSAILGVVTVRLHDDTIRSMIELKISHAELDPADKQKWTDGLRSLPADSIKHLTMELLSKGLEKAPDILQLLQRYIPS